MLQIMFSQNRSFTYYCTNVINGTYGSMLVFTLKPISFIIMERVVINALVIAWAKNSQ